MASLIISNKFLGKPAFTVKHLESGDQSASVLLAADGFLNLPGKDLPVMSDEPSKHLEVEIVFDENNSGQVHSLSLDAGWSLVLSLLVMPSKNCQ